MVKDRFLLSLPVKKVNNNKFLSQYKVLPSQNEKVFWTRKIKSFNPKIHTRCFHDFFVLTFDFDSCARFWRENSNLIPSIKPNFYFSVLCFGHRHNDDGSVSNCKVTTTFILVDLSRIRYDLLPFVANRRRIYIRRNKQLLIGKIKSVSRKFVSYLTKSLSRLDQCKKVNSCTWVWKKWKFWELKTLYNISKGGFSLVVLFSLK